MSNQEMVFRVKISHPTSIKFYETTLNLNSDEVTVVELEPRVYWILKAMTSLILPPIF